MNKNVAAENNSFFADGKFSSGQTKLALLISRHLLSKKRPEEVFDYFQKNHNIISGIILPKKIDEKAYGAISKVSEALLVGGSALYCVGMMTILIVPVVGYAIGGVGAYGAYYGYKALKDKERKFEFAKIFYSSLIIMKKADNQITEEEKRQLEFFFSSFDFTDKQISELMKIDTNSAKDLIVPKWFENEHKIAILTGSWSMASCDGISAHEEKAFASLGEVLGFTSDKMNEIKNSVTHDLDDAEQMLASIGMTTSSYLSGMTDVDRENSILFLSALNAKADSAKRLSERISFQSVFADTLKAYSGKKEMIRSVIAGSMVLAKCLDAASDSRVKIVDEKYQDICKTAGLEKEGEKYHNIINEIFRDYKKS